MLSFKLTDTALHFANSRNHQVLFNSISRALIDTIGLPQEDRVARVGILLSDMFSGISYHDRVNVDRLVNSDSETVICKVSEAVEEALQSCEAGEKDYSIVDTAASAGINALAGFFPTPEAIAA